MVLSINTISRPAVPTHPIVIARSPKGNEAIQNGAAALDCFAELVIGPATSGRTRWLAVTSTSPLVLMTRILTIVTTGLDPVVHADQTEERHKGESQKRRLCMDCRVRGTPPRQRGGDPTPGNDDAEEHSRGAFLFAPEFLASHCTKAAPKK
jgi:hypothetical protein